MCTPGCVGVARRGATALAGCERTASAWSAPPGGATTRKARRSLTCMAATCPSRTVGAPHVLPTGSNRSRSPHGHVDRAHATWVGHVGARATGTGGVYATTNIALDRRSINTAGKLNLYSSSSNFNFIDLYLVNAGESIEGVAPFRSGVISRISNPSDAVNAGSYDVYVTSFADAETIAGPLPLDVAIGDVIDMVIFDTADTAQLEIVVYPAAP